MLRQFNILKKINRNLVYIICFDKWKQQVYGIGGIYGLYTHHFIKRKCQQKQQYIVTIVSFVVELLLTLINRRSQLCEQQ